ncbi:MAG: hypothetical protein JSR39_05430 [Verrucomicrobia bacterium]|nr:hypothetical protein [Verrucomicrobiota bacterium]
MATAVMQPSTVQARLVSADDSNALSSSQAQPRNFLHRCVQELDPEVAANHESDAYWSDLAAKAALVAIGIFGVATIVGIGLVSTVNLPIALFALPFVFPATLFVGNTAADYYWKYSEDSAKSQQKADKLRGIAQEYHSLPENAALTGIKLATMHIQWNRIPGVQQPEDLNRLRPLIARYEYWRKQQEGFESNVNTLTAEASRIANPTGDATPEIEIDPETQLNLAATARLRALKAQENALASKAYAAFMHAVILRPEYAGSGFNDVAKVKFNLSASALIENNLARQFNEPGADHFIVFQDRNIQPITIAEIRDNPIHVVAQRFVQSIAAA